MKLEETKRILERRLRMYQQACYNWSQIQLQACRENNASKVVSSIIWLKELTEKKENLADQLIRVVILQSKLNQI